MLFTQTITIQTMEPLKSDGNALLIFLALRVSKNKVLYLQIITKKIQPNLN